MNLLAYSYSCLISFLYILGYPIRVLFNRGQNMYARTSIYTIARCCGYTKENATLLVKQSNLETGYQTSDLYKRAKNLFGMMRPKIRETTSNSKGTMAEDGLEFAVYKTLAHSVIDRILWDKYNKIPSDASNYVEMVISDGYATDGNYKNKVLGTPLNFNPNIGFITTSIYSGVVMITLIWYRYFRK